MASTLIFWLFLAFLFGTMMAILMIGYGSVEQRRAEEEQLRKAQEKRAMAAATAVPRFFVNSADSVESPGPVLVSDAMLADLENYLREEQVAVAKFVDQPSIERLYGNSASVTDVN